MHNRTVDNEDDINDSDTIEIKEIQKFEIYIKEKMMNYIS